MSRALRSLTMAILLTAAGSLPAAAADVAEEILAKGIEAYHAGKLEPAIGGINAALRARLPAAQVARAHYYRGLAYRKQGNPGRAISDLTRALDYPGLTDAERSDAMEARSAAYQEAGIADEETVVVATEGGARVKPAHAAPPARTEAARSAAANGTWTTASTSTSIAAPPAAQAAVPNWDGATQVAIAAPLAPALPALTASAASAPAPDKREPATALAAADRAPTSKWSGSTQVAMTIPVQPPAARQKSQPQAAQPTPPVAAPIAKATAPATPSAKRAASPAAPATGAATQIVMAPLPPIPVHKAAALPATPSWSTAQVAVAAPSPPAKPLAPATKPVAPFVTQVAAVMPAAPPASPPVAPLAAPPSGPAEVRLLVGEARSRSEAFALAIRLTSQRGAALGPRKPQIAETTIANMGLVYRVRLGPFADMSQAQSLCQSLRSSGYPCIAE